MRPQSLLAAIRARSAAWVAAAPFLLESDDKLAFTRRRKEVASPPWGRLNGRALP